MGTLLAANVPSSRQPWAIQRCLCPKQENDVDCGVLCLAVAAHIVAGESIPEDLDASVFLQNGKDAQALNAVFANLSASDSCNGMYWTFLSRMYLTLPLEDGEMACVSNSLAHCVNATWQLEACSKSLSCFALPSVREQGIVRKALAI